MDRSLKIRILLVAILFAIAGILIGRNFLPSISPSPENALWLAAPAGPTAPPATTVWVEAETLAAQADAVSLEQRLEAAKHAIEEALQMVKEQRDNFDFAEERYNRLMPLVEKGTLDLMTASQIQSAYIAARASLSQAKFYLGQAQREYGTPETRKILVQAARSKVEAIRQRRGLGAAAAAPGAGQIIAEFSEAALQKIQPGTSARVFCDGQEFAATVRQIDGAFLVLDPVNPPANLPSIRRCRVEFGPSEKMAKSE